MRTGGLAELARLRWVEKWKYERLAKHFDLGRKTIRDLIRKIKLEPTLGGISVPPSIIRGR